MPTGAIEFIKPQTFIDVFDGLSQILESEEWVEVKKIWSLLEPRVWLNYDLMGVKDLHEQRLLNAALQKLKPVWRKNKVPGFFGKHIDVENYEADSAQSPAECTVQSERPRNDESRS